MKDKYTEGMVITPMTRSEKKQFKNKPRDRIMPSPLLHRLLAVDPPSVPTLMVGPRQSSELFRRIECVGNELNPQQGIIVYSFEPGEIKKRLSLKILYQTLQSNKQAVLITTVFPPHPPGMINISSSFTLEELLDKADNVVFAYHPFFAASQAYTTPLAVDVYITYKFNGQARVHKYSYCEVISPWSKLFKAWIKGLTNMTGKAHKAGFRVN